MTFRGGFLAVGMLPITGLPPFGIFVSEFALIRAGFAAGDPWLIVIVLALLAVAFIALIDHLNRMLYGAAPEGVAAGERGGGALAPVLCNVAVLAVLRLLLPP